MEIKLNDIQNILEKLLGHAELRSPFMAGSNVSYREDLATKFQVFLREIREFTSEGIIESQLKNRVNELENVCEHILRSVDAYLSGSAGIAYDELERLFNESIIKDNIIHLTKGMVGYDGTERSLYRVRYSDTNIVNRNEMFHIPFQLRHLVGTQRYSIAGVPCLYLGASLYVCWQEMGTPDLNKLYLSRFNYTPVNGDKIKYLDFAYSLETLRHISLERFVESREEDISKNLAQMIFFPILIACSYNRKHQTANFHEEYIIPNLLLQWISKVNDEISGISYLSTKTHQMRNCDIGINFVFPPETSSMIASGFCSKLSDSFKLSKPVSWQLLDTITAVQNEQESPYQRVSDINESYLRNYRSTKFYEQECKLKDMGVDFVGS